MPTELKDAMITHTISQSPDAIAPDGSEVRILAATRRGSMAEFTLPAGKQSKAVAHKSVEEVWFVTSGQGEIWRKNGTSETTISLSAGVSISIEPATHFQFRNSGNAPLKIIGTTMPPWPGMDEAYDVQGVW